MGDLYEHAVSALSGEPQEMVNLIVASHCLRELVNPLPDVLGDVDGLPERSNVESPTQDLRDVWERHRDTLGDANAPNVPSTGVIAGEVPKVSVPLEVRESARRVVAAHRAGSSNNRARASALVLGHLTGGRDPSVRLFLGAMDFFMRFVHLDRSRSRAMPDPLEVLRNLDIIEAAMASRLRDFFTVKEEILDMVASANRRVPREAPK